MAFVFPSSPALNDTVIGPGGTRYLWNGVRWLVPQPDNFLTLADAQATFATHTQLDDAIVSATRYQGTWEADTNTPDLSMATRQQNGFSWIVTTPDPNTPVTVPATPPIPGLNGVDVRSGDHVTWSDAASAFQLVTGPSGVPAGGATYEALIKQSANNFDVDWQDPGWRVGFSNVGIGANALFSTTTAGGGGNTALGRQALLASDGSGNTGIGFQALSNTVSDSYNTAVGQQALGDLGLSSGTGDSNVAVGFRAGTWWTDAALANQSLTTVNNGVFIGMGTRAAADNSTNEIVIGAGAWGKGSNTVLLGNAQTTDLYTPGKITVGTPTGPAVAAAGSVNVAGGFFINGVAAPALGGLGGDLSGTLANAVVNRIGGQGLALGSPAAGQVLAWSTTPAPGAWVPANPTTAVGPFVGLNQFDFGYMGQTMSLIGLQWDEGFRIRGEWDTWSGVGQDYNRYNSFILDMTALAFTTTTGLRWCISPYKNDLYFYDTANTGAAYGTYGQSTLKLVQSSKDVVIMGENAGLQFRRYTGPPNYIEQEYDVVRQYSQNYATALLRGKMSFGDVDTITRWKPRVLEIEGAQDPWPVGQPLWLSPDYYGHMSIDLRRAYWQGGLALHGQRSDSAPNWWNSYNHYQGLALEGAFLAFRGSNPMNDGWVIDDYYQKLYIWRGTEYGTYGQSILIFSGSGGGGGYTLTAQATCRKPGGGAWADIASDMRVKHDIAPYTAGLAQICQLKPVSYYFDAGAGAGPADQRYVGLIAQDVQPVMPEVVSLSAIERDGEKMLTNDTTPVFYALINAVRQLADKVDRIEARLPSRGSGP